VVDGLLPLARARGDQARADAWAQARSGWARALDEAGWDGAWYRRAYFDDGSALGAAANPECKIDLIAQAWAVLAGAGQPQRARTAMASASRLLIDGGAGVVRLLDPPLQLARPSAGYIQSYPSGVRENGGQYNHAGVWALMALAKLGQAEAAWQVFTLLSPAHRWQQAARGAAYGLEPYVMAGDIYTQSPYVGRGGWSWYTGSAGWLARAAVESLCGVLLGHDSLVVTPCLPPHWPQASVRLQRGGRQWRIVLCRDSAAASNALALLPQARRLPAGERVALADLPDGAVRVVVQQPASAP
jgi:cyclic beta-1,2-glucan synthetase